MSDIIDGLAKAVAQRISRRQLIGGAAAAAAGGTLGVLGGAPDSAMSPPQLAAGPSGSGRIVLTSIQCGTGTPCGAICCSPGSECETIGGLPVCVPGCGNSPTSQLCGIICTDLLDDPDNCGWCGHVCPPPPTTSTGASTGVAVCSAGGCRVSCNSGYTACQTSSGAWECVTGECPPTCSSSTCSGTCCGSQCTNLKTDPNNCGKCGNICPAPAHGIGVCSNGTCSGFTCDYGYSTCGSTCVDLATDPSNCGACGYSCTSHCPPPNGWTSLCAGGVCENLQTNVMVC